MPREMYAAYFKGGKFRTDTVKHPATGRPIHVRISEARANIRRDWGRTDHWDYYVVVSYEGRSLSLPYSTGVGWAEDSVKAEHVLEALKSDWWEDGYTFEEFCSDLGYERNAASRKAFDAVSKQNAAVNRVFGEDFKALVYGEDN